MLRSKGHGTRSKHPFFLSSVSCIPTTFSSAGYVLFQSLIPILAMKHQSAGTQLCQYYVTRLPNSTPSPGRTRAGRREGRHCRVWDRQLVATYSRAYLSSLTPFRFLSPAYPSSLCSLAFRSCERSRLPVLHHLCVIHTVCVVISGRRLKVSVGR